MTAENIDFQKEMKRGYMVFRAFEYGLELADMLKSIEEDLSKKKRELPALNKKIEAARENAQGEIDRIEKAATAEINHITDNTSTAVNALNESVNEKEEELRALVDKTKAQHKKIAEAVKKLGETEKKIADAEERYHGLINSIQQAKEQISRFVE